MEQGREDEIEVREFIRDRVWNEDKLSDLVNEELVDHIADNISPVLQEEADVAWWMPQSNGQFTT